MPDVIAHKGASLTKGMTHYWLTTEGVFGVALGVSTGMVFMFVLFGSLLESAGAGNYFIRTAFAGLGHMRGGPAKAAVVSSGLTGLVSGSSIANVVTTGTFTIPLMKKVGYKRQTAGAVEAGSEDLVKKIEGGWLDFDVAIAEPLIYDWASEGSNWSGSQGFGLNPHIKGDHCTLKAEELGGGCRHARHFMGVHMYLGKIPAVFLKSVYSYIPVTAKDGKTVYLFPRKKFKHSLSGT